MSLDGCIAGPYVSPEEPTGRGGEALHDWMFHGRSADESQQFQTDTEGIDNTPLVTHLTDEVSAAG
jgi:hypothetical protein